MGHAFIDQIQSISIVVGPLSVAKHGDYEIACGVHTTTDISIEGRTIGIALITLKWALYYSFSTDSRRNYFDKRTVNMATTIPLAPSSLAVYGLVAVSNDS